MKFIGLDAHSNTCFFVVLGKTKRILKKLRVTTNESNLLAFVRGVKGPKKLVFEEGVMSQWLFLLLKDEVDELVVCQPKEHDGPKNDEKDAWDLADLLRVGRLKSVFHADNELMNLRTLVSGHDDLIDEITREKNRLKALFRQVARFRREKSSTSRRRWSGSCRRIRSSTSHVPCTSDRRTSDLRKCSPLIPLPSLSWHLSTI